MHISLKLVLTWAAGRGDVDWTRVAGHFYDHYWTSARKAKKKTKRKKKQTKKNTMTNAIFDGFI